MSHAEVPVRARRYAICGSALELLLAAALLTRLLTIANPVERSAELLQTIALVGAYAVPGLLGVLSLRGRPALALAGGILGLPLGLSAMSGVSIVLWIPSLLLLAAYSVWGDSRPSRAPAAVVALVAFLLGTGAFAANLVQTRTVCWTYTTDAKGHTTYTRTYSGGHLHSLSGTVGVGQSGAGCSETGTTRGALGALGLTVITLGACWWLSAPRRPQSSTRQAVTTNVS